MARSLFLHAGAHRTGTSSFQLMLAQNRARLEAVGVCPIYPGREGAPGGRLRLRLPGPSAGPRRRARFAAGLADELRRQLDRGGAASRIVLSEENIPGRMLHFFSGAFFPAAADRAALLAAALGAQGLAPPERLVYVVRPYADLFVSAYRKRAEDNPVAPFSELAPAMAGIARGWPETVAALQAALRPRDTCVLVYSERGRSTDLLGRLLGEAIPGLTEPDRIVNRSATDAALQALQIRYRAGETLTRPEWQAVISRHSDVSERRGFAEFTPDQERALRERYARDLERLAALPGIRFPRQSGGRPKAKCAWSVGPSVYGVARS